MSNPKRLTSLTSDGADALTELALNLHWSWNHAADNLWKRLDADLWHSTQNPWVILQTVSQEKVKAALTEPDFRRQLDDLLGRLHKANTATAWFQRVHPKALLKTVAYFSMEFMLSEALPIYSGGLGNVAGDQLKAASDLGVPVIGIGLLYGQGYFRQNFDSDGRQQALYPVNDPGQLPIRPLRQASGEWLRLHIQLPGASIWLRCWEVSVGRTKLYLLDTNDFANSASQRGITSQLYGGDQEMRLRQELVLGIGGWRLLRALDIQPDVCHLNEGHAAFAVLERARSYMGDNAKPFDLAMKVTRAGNLFTTHTAVAAGFDRFDPALIRKYLTYYTQQELHISIEDLLAMGREDAEDNTEPFNMAYLAVRGSGQVNGVSKLHRQVSRHIFQPLFARWPETEVPIGSVTNGIHVPTWDSASADDLWSKACGEQRWLGDRPDGDKIRRLADSQLWAMRTEGRKVFIAQLRKRYGLQLAAEGGDAEKAATAFSEDTLTIGFARRFATYKRPNLLLHDPERLICLLSNEHRPMQLVLAGKAHPKDLPGQALIKNWNDFLRRPDAQSRVIFLSDYDMMLAQELVQGIDLWINTPRRPWEACGTSGMKVLVNGGLNLSELDGWWAEAYSPKVGWAIGDGKEHGEDAAWDAHEADTMYSMLEQEVAPAFYERASDGLPAKWLARMRESMARLTPQFSASRTIREYTQEHYLPAAIGYHERSANDSALGVHLLQWQQAVNQHWHELQFGPVECTTRDGSHIYHAQLFGSDTLTGSYRVELYAGDNESLHVAQTIAMEVCLSCHSPKGALTYTARVSAIRPATDYTVRVVSYHEDAAIPLESTQILWAH